MIARIRRTIVLISLASLAAVLILLCAGINGGASLAAADRADALIQIIYENDGEIPSPASIDGSPEERKALSPETPFASRYYILHVDAEGLAVETDDERIAPERLGDARAAAEEALGSARSTGYSGSYRFGVFQQENGDRIAIVLDQSLQKENARTMLVISAIVSLACLLMVLALLIPLSKRFVRPFEENLARQRTFVTDASHELKTPLAVIAANTDLAEAELGETRWSISTRTQAERMGKLVSDLIDLARADERANADNVDSVDLSTLVSQAVEDLQPLAEACGMGMEASVSPGVTCIAHRPSLERLVGILLDNAIKYGDSGGTVRVSLSRKHRFALLEVSNPCASWDDSQAERVFDRFYRPDASRNRATGGHGVGLAIARAVVQGHGGKLEVRSKQGIVTFAALIPRARKLLA